MKPDLCILVVVPILFLASCATLDRSPELEVSVEHISAPQIHVFESRATVKIRIDNETAEPVMLLGGVHHIRINGRRIGKAMDNAHTVVQPFSFVTRDLPLMVSNLGVIRSTRETIDNKAVVYRLDSRLTIETASGSRSCSLRREGEVSLDEFIPAGPVANGLTPVPIAP
jgi:LEA14-like dessication related protein